MGFFDRFKNQKERELEKAGGLNASGSALVVAAKEGEEMPLKKLEEPTPPVQTRAVRLPGNSARVLVTPLLTEKAAGQTADAKYVFEVSPEATKITVRQAVETAFGVHVKEVNIMRVAGKMVRFGRTHGRRMSWKKAIVTLSSGEKIDVYGGV